MPAVVLLAASLFLPLLQFLGEGSGAWRAGTLVRWVSRGGLSRWRESWPVLLWTATVLTLLIDLGWFVAVITVGEGCGRRRTARVLFIITEIVLSLFLVGTLAVAAYLALLMFVVPSWGTLCLLLAGWCTSMALRAEARA